MARVLIDLKPLVDKVRFELALEMGDLPDSGLADVLEQIAEHDDYSEEIVTAVLRSGLSFAILEAAQLEVHEERRGVWEQMQINPQRKRRWNWREQSNSCRRRSAV